MSIDTPNIADQELPREFGEAIDGLALGMFSIDQVRAGLATILQKNGDGAADIHDVLEESMRDGRLSDADYKILTTDVNQLMTEDAPTEWSRGVDNLMNAQRESALQSLGTSEEVVAATRARQAAARVPDSASRVPEKLAPGLVLRNRFKLDSHIEAGSMGEIFRATDFRKLEAGSADASVAIKIISEKFSRFPNALKALQQEAANGQRLSHPNIVRVFDFDRHGNHFYMTMEWLEGESLVNILNTNRFRPLPFEKGMAIIDGICNGLIYAHGQGVIHADIKPGNIFLTSQGEVKLLDFGIARAGHTAQGGFDPALIGAHTPAYSSCEVLEGKPPTEQDDVYSLACIAYRIFAGRRAFSGFTALESESHAREPKPIETLSSGQWQALRHAMAYRRDDRTLDVATFLDEFSKAPRAEQTGQSDEELVEPTFDDGSSRMPLILGGIASLAIAAMVAVSLWPREQSVDVAAPATNVVESAETETNDVLELSPMEIEDPLAVDETGLFTDDLLDIGEAPVAGELVVTAPGRSTPSTLTDYTRLARQRMDEGFLVEPSGDNATHYLNLVRAERPDSPAYEQGAYRLANLMMLEAMIAITDKDFALAEKWLQRAKSLDAERGSTTRVARELAKARAAEAKRESKAFSTVFASTAPPAVLGGEAPELPAEPSPKPPPKPAPVETRRDEPTVAEEPAKKAAEDTANSVAGVIVGNDETGEVAALPDDDGLLFPDTESVAPSLIIAPDEPTVEKALAARVIDVPDTPSEPVAVEPDEIALSDLEFSRFIEPTYPRRASATRGNGWVDVRFRVNEKGTVEDVQVMEAEPKGMFENAARRAVERWRFKPLIVDGVPTATYSGVRLRFEATE